MQSVQRQFGKLLSKSPGDNAKVSVLLNDYEDADKVLAKIIDSTKSWRDSWVALVSTQLGVVTEYEGLYDPIVGASDGHGKEAVPTPELQLSRTLKLKEVYADLKSELIEEVSNIDARIIKPATDARDCIHPIRKTIKKRENKRLDYEKCQDKINKLQRKMNRSSKEDASLARAEEEVLSLAEEFQIADTHLRETLPPIITAAFSLIPPLLAGHVLMQNRLLGLYYTVLHDYCEDQGFPSPPPPMDDVIAEWSASYKPAQRDVESIGCVARGKAVHQPMNMGTDLQPQSRKQSVADNFRRSSSGLIPSAANGGPQRPLRVPSASSLSTSPNPSEYSPQPSPRPPPSPNFKRPDYLAPTDFTTATMLGQSPSIITPSSATPRTDYFSRDRPSTASTVASSTSSLPLDGIAIAIAKKKPPPPPPPPKRVPSTKPEEFVVAKYSFTGQGEGDLSFREGDLIKIVKKTNTDQDWWVGELGGVKGNFPANYCKAL